MKTSDWTPPKTHTRTSPSPWKVDVDRGEVRIYEVPEPVGNMRLPIRLVASCPNRSVAELIVRLYNEYRESR